MSGLIKDDGEIVCHYMHVSRGRSDSNFIESDLVLGVLLAIILFELF
jgi:hypothetical protein